MDEIEADPRDLEELKRLKRQYRIMINDKRALLAAYAKRKSYHAKTLQLLTKRLDDLHAEHVDDRSFASINARNRQRIDHLLTHNTELDAEIDTARKQLSELHLQIVKMDANLQRKARISAIKQANLPDLNDHQVGKKLENRLDTLVKQYCGVLAENRELRDEVHSLLIERKQFNQQWMKLQSNYADGKRFLSELIEQSTVAFTQREESAEKLRVLRIKSQGKLVSHSETMKELKRKLDLQDDLSKFLDTKSRKRILADIERKEREKQQRIKHELDAQLEEFSHIKQAIFDFVGESDVNKVASIYLKQEEENFALFSYVNELNAEVDLLHDDTIKLQQKLDDQREINKQRENVRNVEIANLTVSLDRHVAECDDIESVLNQKETSLREVIELIERVFKVLECDNEETPLIKLLGNRAQITQHNLLLYITIMENKLLDVLLLKRTRK